MRIILLLYLLIVLIAMVIRSEGTFIRALSPQLNKGSDSNTFSNRNGTVGHGLQDRKSAASSEDERTDSMTLGPLRDNGSFLSPTDLENTLEYLNDHVKSILKTEQTLQDDQTRLDSEMDFLSSTFHGIMVSKIQDKGTIPTFPSTGADPFHPSISDCGGITVSDKGFIVHKSGLNHTQKIICIWTIRSNTAEKIALRLVSDNLDLDTSKLVVTPLKHMLRESLTFQTALWFQRTLVPGDRNEYQFEGCCVFVTLITNATTSIDLLRQPSFALYFEARGNSSTYSNTTFTHFNYQSYSGMTTYPNGPSYQNNEIATFVLNPPVAKGNLKVKLPYTDIRFCGLCTCDFVKLWEIKKTRMNFMYWGDPETDFRNCGTNSNLRDVGGSYESESWIVIFYSDGSGTGKGFRLSWSSN